MLYPLIPLNLALFTYQTNSNLSLQLVLYEFPLAGLLQALESQHTYNINIVLYGCVLQFLIVSLPYFQYYFKKKISSHEDIEFHPSSGREKFVFRLILHPGHLFFKFFNVFQPWRLAKSELIINGLLWIEVKVEESFYDCEENHIVFQYPPGIVRMTNENTLAVATFKKSRDSVGCTVWVAIGCRRVEICLFKRRISTRKESEANGKRIMAFKDQQAEEQSLSQGEFSSWRRLWLFRTKSRIENKKNEIKQVSR